MDFTHLTILLSHNPALAIPIVFAGGVLTSLTPCIYPMIPITVAIVGGTEISGELSGGAVAGATAGAAPRRVSRWRPLTLTLAYVVGLALVYAALGLFAGLTGTLFGTVSTNPWLYFAMANVLVLAALAMLDVLPVRVPAALLARASAAGTAGRHSGAFVMGAMSGLVAAPCSAPVMAAVLTWVTTTRSAALGFLYLFVFSLGMCTLLVAVGLSSGTLARLPRAGVWMLWIKRAFAIVMLGVAEYYLVRMGQLII
ncbi:MAG TPA: cytochrome c biogenesis protein CcdA [Gemmatimonadaceae bacterium]|nr:cytochrome c biogenesis protein CcdA [Gemmatimonadaceae bacterium]